MGIDLNELYSAQLSDGDINPPEWNIEGRQVNVYKQVFQPRPRLPVLTRHLSSGNLVTFLSLYLTSPAQDVRREKVAELSNMHLRTSLFVK